MTLLYNDSYFQKHDTGRHPETAERLRAINGRLAKSGLLGMCATGTYKPLDLESLARIHSPQQIIEVQQLAEQGGGGLDLDTVVSPDSFNVALAAAGACVAAVDAVLLGPDRNALCLVRPPGHHATLNQSMGFCLFNNVALAANHARIAHQLRRILILDWDVHHGNGTQDIFYDVPEVLFFSIHRYGQGFYPGTGGADERGEGKGEGFTVNEPIRFGTSRQEFRDRFSRALEQAAEKIKPELVLISAGFDAHARDPIGSLGLEVEDFSFLTQKVLEVARTYSQNRVVSCLEGGYHLNALAESVQAHLEELLGTST